MGCPNQVSYLQSLQAVLQLVFSNFFVSKNAMDATQKIILLSRTRQRQGVLDTDFPLLLWRGERCMRLLC